MSTINWMNNAELAIYLSEKEAEIKRLGQFSTHDRLTIFLRMAKCYHTAETDWYGQEGREWKAEVQAMLDAIKEMDNIPRYPTLEESREYERIYSDILSIKSEISWYERNKDAPYPRQRYAGNRTDDNYLNNCYAGMGASRRGRDLAEIEYALFEV